MTRYYVKVTDLENGNECARTERELAIAMRLALDGAIQCPAYQLTVALEEELDVGGGYDAMPEQEALQQAAKDYIAAVQQRMHNARMRSDETTEAIVGYSRTPWLHPGDGWTVLPS